MESSTPADIGARRWLIIECRNNLDQRALATLATAIGNNGDDKPGAIKHFANGFKHHLQQVDLAKFNSQLLPEQDTGMQTKIHNHYKQDPVYAFLVEWISAPKLTLYRHMVDHVDGSALDRDEALEWGEQIRFSDMYAVFSEMSKEAHGRVIGRNRIGPELQKYGIELLTKAGNVRYVKLPVPRAMLMVLRVASRFDRLVSEQQEEFINGWPHPEHATLTAPILVADRVAFAAKAVVPASIIQ